MPISDDLLKQIENGDIEDNLYLSNGDVDDVDVIKLAEALRKNSSIKIVSLLNQNIGDVGVAALAAVDTIEELDITNSSGYYTEYSNHVTAAGAQSLSKSHLKKLNISGNQIEDTGLKCLSENVTITELIASDCGIGSDGLQELFKVNITMKKINLSDNQIGNLGLSTIALNHTVEDLNLSNCDISGEGTEYISQNNSLIKLELMSNDLSECSKNLANHPKLKSLNLSTCQIGDDVACYFAESTINILNLSNNKITSDGIKNYSKNTYTTYIDLSFNQIDTTGLNSIVNMKSIKQIFMEYNAIEEDAIDVMRTAFSNQNACKIKCVNLSGNNVSTPMFVNRKRKLDQLTDANHDDRTSKKRHIQISNKNLS